MGIKQLFKLIKEKAPNSYREVAINIFTSKTVAYDASKTIYQFMVSTTNYQSDGQTVLTLADSEGNPTGHLMGFIYKSLLMLESGITPIWVFDGIPPEAKKHELKKRKMQKLDAIQKEDEAKELQIKEDILKYAVRHVKVTPKMTEDAIKLLTLMGIPVLKAKSEAEAQCVQMLKAKIIDAVASDDMDCLTFGCKTLIKGVKTKKDPIIEINLEKVLEEMKLNMDEFIDLCILCGCDYLPTIPKLGPATALKYIEKYRTIEKILEVLEEENKEFEEKNEKLKFVIPQDFDFQTARDLFKNPEVFTDLPKYEINPPDEENLRKFLIEEKNFAEDRVEGLIKRLEKAKKSKPQMTLESFFGRPTIVKKNPKDKITNKKKTKKN
jgi:flap endonuclease-1